MNKSYEPKEFFYTGQDWDDHENGTGSPYGPVYSLGLFFNPNAEPILTRQEQGLCRWSHPEPIYDRLTQTCLTHFVLHLVRREERNWDDNYGLKWI